MKKLLIVAVVLILICSAGGFYIISNMKNNSADNKNVQTEISQNKTKTKPAFAKEKENTSKTKTNIAEKADSKNFDILPTMESASSAKNKVWAGAFQLVWNDLMDELIKGPVKFLADQPAMVDLLNKQEFTTQDIEESAYYKKWGLASPALKKEIEDGIWAKFKEKSQILDMANWAPAPCKYALYTMMKKDLEYEKEFESLQEDKFDGSEKLVKYFGIEEEPYGRNVKETVRVLFYNDDKDFAVTLRSKQGDLIHLYRVNTDKNLAEIYAEMMQKTKRNSHDYLQNIDRFKAPKINFNKVKEFKELYGKPMVTSKEICGDPIEITKAIERIEFKMDEVDAKVVAEALIMTQDLVAAPDSWEPTPRYFYFTGPYAIFMQEPGKHPYFAAYIKDPASIQ